MLNDYSIRGIGKSIDIFLNEKKVGDRVLPIALEELHKDAIYFLAGIRYKVKEFDYPKKNFAKLERIPRDFPTLRINTENTDINKFSYTDFKLCNYNPHPKIHLEMAV